ncbi:hypothetical protein [Desertivirga arenae]|uniref:hypothetical protein n=1 Tax=Desertivirga arenae TaxID=2810309 RepID=UPI001A9786BE|nr:hypothetical protein [Pedobacter sp. SYSU D00823]
MKKITLIFLVAILFCLTACDPVHSFAVYNASAKERKLQVIGISKDSILIQEQTSKGNFGKSTMIAVDFKTEEKPSFEFILPPNKQAHLEFGFGIKPVTKLIIVDQSDTIRVKQRIGRLKKKPFYRIGGNFRLTLKD